MQLLVFEEFRISVYPNDLQATEMGVEPILKIKLLVLSFGFTYILSPNFGSNEDSGKPPVEFIKGKTESQILILPKLVLHRCNSSDFQGVTSAVHCC